MTLRPSSYVDLFGARGCTSLSGFVKSLSSLMLLPTTVFGTPLLFSPLCHSNHLLRVAISGSRASLQFSCSLHPLRSSPLGSGPTGSESSFFWKHPTSESQSLSFRAAVARACVCVRAYGCLVTSSEPFSTVTRRDARHSRSAAPTDRTGPDRNESGRDV